MEAVSISDKCVPGWLAINYHTHNVGTSDVDSVQYEINETKDRNEMERSKGLGTTEL